MTSFAFPVFFKKAVVLPLMALVIGAFGAFAGQDDIEFPEQTEALVAATTALFETVEGIPANDGLQMRIDGLAIPASLGSNLSKESNGHAQHTPLLKFNQ